MPITTDLNRKSNVKFNSAGDLLSNLSQPVINRYNATSTAGQTTISLPFLIDQANTDACFVFINGQKLTFGASNDYIFSAIDGTNSSSLITLNAALVSGLNIEVFKMGLKKEVEFQTDARFTQVYNALGAGFQGFVDESSRLTAINGAPGAGQFRSSITNRAPITDLANDLKVRMGIDRVMTQQIYQLQNEFGPNGEPVWAALNDDKGLIRFVGNWSNNISNDGQFVLGSTVGDFVEITFYGTGLNLLAVGDTNNRDVRVTIDSGSESGSSIFPTSQSGVISGRNYSQNKVYNAASGLSLGVHTVKFRWAATSNFPVYGFEVLNESANVNVRPGTAYLAGKQIVSSAASSVAYNGGTFDSVLRAGASTSFSSARGARVLTYIKSDGTIGKSAYLTNSAQANLASADHTYEEVARTYHWREFGAGRSDDFSLPTGAAFGAKAFTLDDGTTTLITSNGGSYSNDGYSIGDALNAFTTFTFVGTGLDILMGTNQGTPSDTITVYVDGSSIGTLPTSSNTNTVLKIVSGLPYGTHTVKFFRTVFSVGLPLLKNFIVYQPKKPSLPSGAVELADYNVMANFVANTTAGQGNISTGILRKDVTREMVFVEGTGGTNSWQQNSGIGATTQPGIADWISDRLNAYLQYTFFGQGFDLRSYAGTNRSSSVQVYLNGVLATTTNFPTLVSSTYGTGSFNSSTGIYNQSGTLQGNSGLVISGLPLGLYTVKFNNNASGQYLDVSTLDIITPLHSHVSNLYADLQNTLPVGSESISDNRQIQPIKNVYTQKAWAQAVGVVSAPSTTSSSAVPMPDMSVTLNTRSGQILVSFVSSLYGTLNNIGGGISVYVDGVSSSPMFDVQPPSAGSSIMASLSVIVPVSSGTHKVDLYWRTTNGTFSGSLTQRVLTVREL